MRRDILGKFPLSFQERGPGGEFLIYRVRIK
jgi:hypothetical protein